MGDENTLTLASPPTDGISAIHFGAKDDGFLLVSSWDSALRLYDARANALRAQQLQPSPLLDCDFAGSSSRALSGGLDGHVRLHELGSAGGGASSLGVHEGAVCAVRHCAAVNAGVTGSWDRTVKLWDARVAAACVGTYAQPDKVLGLCAGTPAAAASGPPLLVVGTAGRHVLLLDLRRPDEPLQTRESSLKCQTRCVAQMPSGAGYAMGSVDGRVALEFVDAEVAQARKYAFKCHREKVGGVDTAYPVNAIAYHPVHGTFATGGADGAVHVWDGERRKRVCSLKKAATSVAALAFSSDGELLAMASSYTYEQGETERPADSIVVRKVAPAEVRPKAPKV